MFAEIKRHRFLSTKIMTSIIRLSLGGIIVASFVSVGILRAQSTLVSKARPSARAKTSSGDARNVAKPTIVLVHGAFADATSWQHVIPILERDGYNQGQRIRGVSAASSVEDDTVMVHRRAGGPGAESKPRTIFRKAHWSEDD